MNKTSKTYKEILKCVDAALKKLGKNIDKSIYYYLKNDFNLEKFEIPEKPEIFERALISIFGEQGAKVLQKLILVEIKNSFHSFPSNRGLDLTFKEAVTRVKRLSVSA